MKKKLLRGIMCAALLVVSVFSSVTVAEEDEEAYLTAADFADPYLYQCVLESNDFNKDGKLTYPELEVGTSIILEKNVSSFKGIEKIPNLVTFIADYFGVSDLSWVKENGKNIETFYIESSTATNFDFLNYLPAAEYVGIRFTSCNNINFVKNMPNLKDLYCVGCGITDYSPLASCKNLNFVEVDGNITSLDVISGCTKLKSFYTCSDTLSDIKALASLHDIERIDFWGSVGVKDFSVLEQCPNLKEVTIVGSGIKTLPNLKSKNLEKVYIPFNYLTKEEAMAKLPANIITDSWISENITPFEEREIVATGESDVVFSGEVISTAEFSASITTEYDSVFEKDIEEIRNSTDGEVDDTVYDLSILNDISTTAGDKTVHMQAYDDSTITIQNIEEDCEYTVIRREDDGSTTELECEVKGDSLTFETEHFSIFAIVKSKSKKQENVTTIATEETTDEENSETTSAKKEETTKPAEKTTTSEHETVIDKEVSIKEDSKSTGNKAVIFIIIGVVVLVCAGAATFMIIKKKKAVAAENTPDSEEETMEETSDDKQTDESSEDKENDSEE